jgi:hypothetical protein
LGYGADLTLAFPSKKGFTIALGQVGSLSNGTTLNNKSVGQAKGAEASTGIYFTLIVPVKPSFTMNDISGVGYSLSGNYGIYGANIFTNDTRSYYGVNFGIGLGIGGSFSKTNTTIRSGNYEMIQLKGTLKY